MIRRFIGFGIYLITALGCAYLFFWWGLLEPIREMLMHLDQNTFTAMVLFKGIVHFVLRELLTGIVGIVGLTIGSVLITS